MSAQNDTATSAQLREIGAPLGSWEEESATEGGGVGVSLGGTSFNGPSIGSAASGGHLTGASELTSNFEATISRMGYGEERMEDVRTEAYDGRKTLGPSKHASAAWGYRLSNPSPSPK